MAKQKAEEKIKPVVPSTPFEIEGRGTFKFKVAAFRIIGLNGNQPILATEALKDPEILLHLVEVKSQVIEKVEVAEEEKEAE